MRVRIGLRITAVTALLAGTVTVSLSPSVSVADSFDSGLAGTADILGRASTTNDLYLYKGNGSGGFASSGVIGTGWANMDIIFSPGDFNGDGNADVLARASTTKDLWLYRGNGSNGFLGSAVISTGWANFDRIFSPGDFDGDGRADVLARASTTKNLYLYRGNGSNGFLGSAVIDTGWGNKDIIFSAGDFNGDARPDVLARHATTKDLWLYRGNGTGGFLGSGVIGTGWGSLDLIFSPGDFDGDGYSDVLARIATSKDLLLYRGNGNGGFLALAVAGHGWGNFDILFSPAWAGAPLRTVDLNKPTYLIHGYGLGVSGYPCDLYWQPAKTAFNTSSGPGVNTGALRTVGFYRGDSNCNDTLPFEDNEYGTEAQEGTHQESIKELGREFAWMIYNKHSRFGQAVDVVGHSMGGLIARAALTGIQRGEPKWPPYIFVEDVVTLATPHGGVGLAYLCAGTTQCDEMQPSSATLDWMNDNPQSDVLGTDWTLVGSSMDGVVTDESAFNMCCAGHKAYYPYPPFPVPTGWIWVDHDNIHRLTSGTYPIDYCDYFGSCNMEDSASPYDSWTHVTGSWTSPITITKLALHSTAY